MAATNMHAYSRLHGGRCRVGLALEHITDVLSGRLLGVGLNERYIRTLRTTSARDRHAPSWQHQPYR